MSTRYPLAAYYRHRKRVARGANFDAAAPPYRPARKLLAALVITAVLVMYYLGAVVPCVAASVRIMSGPAGGALAAEVPIGAFTGIGSLAGRGPAVRLAFLLKRSGGMIYIKIKSLPASGWQGFVIDDVIAGN